MTARAEEGLSTAGGVAAPSGSRAASLRNVDGVIAESKQSHDSHRPTTPMPKPSEEPNKDTSPESTNKNSPEIGRGEMPQSPTQTTKQTNTPLQHEEAKDITAATDVTVATSTDPVDDEMDDDDQIQMAVPTEMMAMGAGDSCAICIDQLEDDEDVRGLTCGHAFHAHCLDPWLTSRRACCPLCKADYYVPKPRPEGEVAAEVERHERGRRQGGSRMDMPRPPQYAFQRHGGGRLLFPSRFMARGLEDSSRNRHGFPSRISRPQRPAGNQHQTQDPALEGQQQNTWRARMGSMLPSISTPRFMSRNNNASATAGAPEIHTDSNVTPAELEAGER